MKTQSATLKKHYLNKRLNSSSPKENSIFMIQEKIKKTSKKIIEILEEYGKAAGKAMRS